MENDISQKNAQNEPIATRRGIAEAMLGQIDWDAVGIRGACRCPGIAEHSTLTGKNDTMIYIDGVPTIFCHHQSCAEQIEAANRDLRKAVLEGDSDAVLVDDVERRKREAATQARERMERRARSSFSSILRQYAWPLEQMKTDSKVDLANTPLAVHAKLMLRLYSPEDVAWIGNPTDSGSAEKAHHFRTTEEWLTEPTPLPGELICPATFKPGSISRSNDNVVCRRFLVVESDVLQKHEVGAIFKWLRDGVELPLLAVVDTGGKSLHGWFEYPPKKHLDELQIVLPALGCDPGMFRASQPARLPGVVRVSTSREQQLVYFGREVAL